LLEQVEAVVEAARSWEVLGYYVVCESERAYLSDNPLRLGNILILVSGLKLSGRQVIVGYANQQLLAAGPAFADVLCSGNFLNTRSFSVGKFYLADEESMSRRATWFYCPQAYSEFKIAYLDLAKRRGVVDQMRPNGQIPQEFCSPLFAGALSLLRLTGRRDLHSGIIWRVFALKRKLSHCPAIKKPETGS